MVVVEEVIEETIVVESEYETDDDVSDTASIASEDDFDPNETLGERIAALRDIISPETRSVLERRYTSTVSWVSWIANATGKLAWWTTTTGLLIGLPLALAIEDEARITQQEREMQMQSQGQQMLGGGQPASGAAGGTGGAKGVVPAGF